MSSCPLTFLALDQALYYYSLLEEKKKEKKIYLRNLQLLFFTKIFFFQQLLFRKRISCRQYLKANWYFPSVNETHFMCRMDQVLQLFPFEIKAE